MMSRDGSYNIINARPLLSSVFEANTLDLVKFYSARSFCEYSPSGRLLVASAFAAEQQTQRKASKGFVYYPRSSFTILSNLQHTFLHSPVVLNEGVERL